MSQDNDNTFNNLNYVFTKDTGTAQKISINTTTTNPEFKVNYDLDTTNPKTFKIDRNGVNFTDNANNSTTTLERLALVQQAFAAVTLPPNSSTLAINKNIQLDYTSDNNIIMDQASNNIDYPVTYPTSNYQTRITKETDDNLNIYHLNDLNLFKSVTPSYTLANLAVTQAALGNYSTLPVQTTIQRALFPDRQKLCYVLTNTLDKIIYIENLNDDNFFTFDLNNVSTVGLSYVSRLSTVYVQQILPVSYTSQTNMKFFVRLGEAPNPVNFYLIECNGDPLLASSYKWATNYGITTAATVGGINPANLKNNGDNAFPLPAYPTSTQIGVLGGVRMRLLKYDSVNNVLIIGNNEATTNRFITVVNPLITAFSVYANSAPTGTSLLHYQYHTATDILFQSMYSTTGNQGMRLRPVRFIISTNSLFVNLAANWVTVDNTQNPGQFWLSNYNNWDTYSFFDGTNYILYYVWLNITDTNNRRITLDRWNWSGLITTDVARLGGTVIQNVLNTELFNPSFYNLQCVYYSIKVNSVNNIEVFSSWNGTNGALSVDGNLFISINGGSTFTTFSVAGILNAGSGLFWTYFSNVENDMTNVSIVYPNHNMVRGRGSFNSDLTNIHNAYSINVVNNSVANPTNYLTFNYNPTLDSASLTSTKLLNVSCNPISINGSSNKFLLTGLTAQTQNSVLTLKNSIVGARNNFYASYAQLTSQILTANTDTNITLETILISNGITLTFTGSSSEINFNSIGIFRIGVYMTVQNASGGNHDFYIGFVDTTGTPIPIANNSLYTKIGSNTIENLYQELLYNSTTVNNKIKIYVYTVSSGLSLITGANPSSLIAVSPAVKVTINQIE